MNEKAEKLIQLLISKNAPVPSKELAEALHVSSRSIRNYISEINHQEQVIISNRAGISINKNKAKQLLRKDCSSDIPQTSRERGVAIIKQMLIYGHNDLNLFDLSDQFYVSYSTIKNDIAHMNKDYCHFNVTFGVKHDLITCTGEEASIRQLVSYILSQETKNQFSSLTILKNIFGEDFIENIDRILNQMILKYHLIINDFSLMNTIMHIAIIIKRVSKSESLNSVSFHYKSQEEKEMIESVVNLLEESFSIHFNNTERYEIALLISSNTYQYDEKMVNEDEIVLLAKNLIQDITDTFHVEINHKNFLPLFAMHLRNLLIRCQNGKFVHNPMKENIKKISPIIYDIAVSMSLEFANRTGYTINDDEISFLAMHIGTALDMNEAEHEKIQTLLICPQYGNMRNQLKSSILSTFHQDLQITEVVSLLEEGSKNFDLILSAIPLEGTYEPEILVISPFFNQLTSTMIEEKIKIIRTRKKNAWIHNRFEDYFGEDFFIVSKEEYTSEEVIHLLSQKMVKANTVPASFEEHVIQRERACPTNFYHFAIPHAADMSAYSTKVGVLIHKNGLNWGTKTVNVVLLLAVNEYDKSLFIDLYNTFIELLSRDEVINDLISCQDFTSFKKHLLHYIDY